MSSQDARSLPQAAQEDIRRKAVRAVLDGHTQLEVAEIFGVTRQAVGNWMKAYRQGGEKRLRAKRRGRPKGGKLQPWQSAQIAKAVTDRNPDQLKLPFYLWTREAVAQLIEQRFQIKLSVWTVGRHLKRWGFSPQKPLRRALEQNPEEVQRWLEHEFPEIRREAKRHKACIYWGDEMGLRSDDIVGRSYGRRGRTPIIPGTGRRFGCQMISAITNQGHLNFMVFHRRFQSAVFIEFLRRLIRQAKRMVFLIVDGHPVHKSGKVKKWLHKHHQNIHLFFLPGYSPELNPDEMLNQDVKSNAVGRRRAKSQSEMTGDVRRYLHTCQKHPQKIKGYFQEKHVRYAAI